VLLAALSDLDLAVMLAEADPDLSLVLEQDHFTKALESILPLTAMTPGLLVIR
jgi:hypothetical protein